MLNIYAPLLLLLYFCPMAIIAQLFFCSENIWQQLSICHEIVLLFSLSIAKDLLPLTLPFNVHTLTKQNQRLYPVTTLGEPKILFEALIDYQ